MTSMRRVAGAALASFVLSFGAAACKSKGHNPLLEAAQRCQHDGDLSCAVPIFNVAELRGSQTYYRDALGFKIDWAHGEPADFGSVSRGQLRIFLCQGCQGTPGGWLMTFTRDVDALHEELRRRGARVRLPPRNMPWGLREMHVSDLDGNVLRFGSAIESDD